MPNNKQQEDTGSDTGSTAAQQPTGGIPNPMGASNTPPAPSDPSPADGEMQNTPPAQEISRQIEDTDMGGSEIRSASPSGQQNTVTPEQGTPQTGPTENTVPTASQPPASPKQNTAEALHTMQEDVAVSAEQAQEQAAPARPTHGERAAGVMPDIEQDIEIQKKNGAHSSHTGLWWAIGIILLLLVAGFILAFLFIEGMISF